MKIISDTRRLPDDTRLSIQRNAACLVVMRMPGSSPIEANTTLQTSTSNTARAVTVTVVAKEIWEQRGYSHGGINE